MKLLRVAGCLAYFTGGVGIPFQGLRITSDFERAAALAAQMINRPALRNRRNPWQKGSRCVISMPHLMKCQKAVLNDVFRRFAVLDLPAHQRTKHRQ